MSEHLKYLVLDLSISVLYCYVHILSCVISVNWTHVCEENKRSNGGPPSSLMSVMELFSPARCQAVGVGPSRLSGGGNPTPAARLTPLCGPVTPLL